MRHLQNRRPWAYEVVYSKMPQILVEVFQPRLSVYQAVAGAAVDTLGI